MQFLLALVKMVKNGEKVKMSKRDPAEMGLCRPQVFYDFKNQFISNDVTL